jgi:hypothetical protein
MTDGRHCQTFWEGRVNGRKEYSVGNSGISSDDGDVICRIGMPADRRCKGDATGGVPEMADHPRKTHHAVAPLLYVRPQPVEYRSLFNPQHLHNTLSAFYGHVGTVQPYCSTVVKRCLSAVTAACATISKCGDGLLLDIMFGLCRVLASRSGM